MPNKPMGSRAREGWRGRRWHHLCGSLRDLAAIFENGPMLRERSLRLALELMSRTRVDALAARLVRPAGVIFALHRVRPSPGGAFNPNGCLEITPEFLDATVRAVRDAGFEFIPLDDVPARLFLKGRKFACITLDDAYRDNLECAYPILSRHKVPFTIFVPDHFADGTGQLWWVELERAIAVLESVEVPGDARSLPCRTVREKLAAFERIYWTLRRMPEDVARTITRQLCTRAGVPAERICRELIMTWDEIKAMSRDPLVRFGAHTSGHYALAKLSCDRAREEMARSKARLEHELGKACRAFCYPYGDEASAAGREFSLAAELGFRTAVTMRKGLLAHENVQTLTALPRCSLNGHYQDLRYVRALLSGAPFLLWKWARALSSPLRPWRHAPVPLVGRAVS